MRQFNTLLFLLIIIVQSVMPSDDRIKYFRMDKIVSVTGEIMAIRTEDRYRKNKFIVIEIKETQSGEIYDIEVAPLWFYKVDIVTGSIIEVNGSLNQIDKKRIVLTQSIIFQGEVFNFRDKFGFPLWRGDKRTFRNNRWKGEMGKKGKN